MLLSEDDAWSKRHQHVGLASVQWIFLGFQGIEDEAAVGVGRLQNFLGGGDGDFLAHLSNDELKGQVELVGDLEDDALPLDALKAWSGEFDIILAGIEVRNGVVAFRSRLGFLGRVGGAIDGPDRGAWDEGAAGVSDLTGD